GRDNVIAVDDLTALLSLLLHGPTPAHSTYLASGHNVTMGELVEVVRTLIPGSAIEFPTPERRPTYPQWFDNRRAVEEFGWKVSSLVDSVRTYVNGVRADAGLASLPAS
ncbi:MAG: NAD(P)-dependent oxidoreductase, partial [Pseudonocardiales bacterium]|nr:NAD(P)-dependent oxidoreductase [Pseudonocardiales bacterium]